MHKALRGVEVDSDKQLRLPDITRNFHGDNPNSIEANESLPATIKSDLERRIARLAIAMKRVGVICDEVEVTLSITHQTASSRMTKLKADGVLVQRFDGTPTEGRFPGVRKTRSGRWAGVFIAAQFADGYELARVTRRRVADVERETAERIVHDVFPSMDVDCALRYVETTTRILREVYRKESAR